MAKQITTFIANKPGTLAEFCRILKEQDLKIYALNVSDAMDFGIVRVIVNDTEKTLEVLKKEDYICQTQRVLLVETEDSAGALTKVLNALGEHNVNLQYTYNLFTDKNGKGGFVLKADDLQKAEEVLKETGVRLISDGE